MDYRLNQKGRTAEIKPTPAGKILEFMQNSHGVVNSAEIEYELQIAGAKDVLDSLTTAGYLSKETPREGLI